jgi:hypothetical protein
MRCHSFERLFGFLSAARRSYYYQQVVPRLREDVFRENVVLNGPFKGMAMPCFSAWAKLVGSYEDELHGAINEILTNDYQTVVNIGCAEGYYAVGMALKLREATIFCFDENPAMLERCRQNARKNQVEARMHFAGRCGPDELGRLDLSKRSLIICDVDGYEAALLQPDQITGLRNCDLLIEVHDYLTPGATAALKQRFRDTHTDHLYREQWKNAGCYPQLKRLSVFEQRVALSEDRWSEDKPVDQEWLLLKAINIKASG